MKLGPLMVEEAIKTKSAGNNSPSLTRMISPTFTWAHEIIYLLSWLILTALVALTSTSDLCR